MAGGRGTEVSGVPLLPHLGSLMRIGFPGGVPPLPDAPDPECEARAVALLAEVNPDGAPTWLDELSDEAAAEFVHALVLSLRQMTAARRRARLFDAIAHHERRTRARVDGFAERRRYELRRKRSAHAPPVPIGPDLVGTLTVAPGAPWIAA